MGLSQGMVYDCMQPLSWWYHTYTNSKLFHNFMCDADEYSRSFLHKKSQVFFTKNKELVLHHLVFRYRAFVPPPLVRDCGRLNTPDVPGPV